MKYVLLPLMVVVALLTSGCSTLQSLFGGQDNDRAEQIVRTGVYVYLQENPDRKQDLVAHIDELESMIKDEELVSLDGVVSVVTQYFDTGTVQSPRQLAVRGALYAVQRIAEERIQEGAFSANDRVSIEQALTWARKEARSFEPRE